MYKTEEEQCLTEVNWISLPTSQLTRNQSKNLSTTLPDESLLLATIRYDDECGNGHNTFAITCELYARGRSEPHSCGCLHDEFAQAFPEYAHLVKWHLCSSDGPMHYIANTLYHALEHGPNKAWVYEYAREIAGVKVDSKCLVYANLDKAEAMVATNPDLFYLKVDEKTVKVANLDYARKSAIAPDATPEQLRDRQWLEDRLPALMDEFKADVESLGFVY